MIRPLAAILALALVATPARADNWTDCAGTDLEKAKRACSRIISVRGQFKDNVKMAVAYANRGRVAALSGDCGSALGDFAEAVKLDPRSRMALAGRGRCHLEAGGVAEARADFDASLAIEPKDIAALVGRGQAAERGGDIHGARRDFAAALRIAPASPADERELALARERLRTLGGSLADATVKGGAAAAPAKRGPVGTGAVGEWAQCEAMAGAASVAACSRIIAGHAGPTAKGLAALAHHFRGRTAFFIGDQIAAAEDLRIVGSLVRDLALGFHERGRVYLAEREPQLALKDFDEALKRMPAFPAAQRDRARAYLALGRPEQALAEIDGLLRSDAGDPLALIVRGLAWQAKGELGRARADIERAFTHEVGPTADHLVIADGRKALTILVAGGPGVGAGAARQASPLGPDPARIPSDPVWNECRSDNPETSLKGCGTLLRQGSGLPDDLRAFALYRSGLAHARASRFDAAITDFDAALRFMPTYVSVLIDRGLAWARKGDNQRALADFDRAHELKADDPRIHLNRGVAYERLNQFDRAIADYSEALRLQAGYMLAHLNRGLLYKLRGDHARARIDLEAVLAATATGSDIQRLQVRAREALAALPASAAAPPPSAAELADCRSNDADKSLAACSAIIARGRTGDVDLFAEILRRRAIAWRSKGDVERSLADATQAITLAPQIAEGYNTRGITYERKGDVARALEDYTEAARRNPEFGLPWANKAALHLKRAEWQAAIADYTQAIRLNPKDPLLHVNRGVAHSRLKSYQASIDDYAAAIRLKADYALAWSNRSISYMLLGNLDAALSDANEAIRLRPTFINALVHRGDVFKRRGDVAKAKADLQAALGLSASNDEERQRQGRAREMLAQLDQGSVVPGPAPGPAPGAGGDSTAGGGTGAGGGPSRRDGLRRVALVIGNASYSNAPQLDHPAIDAREVAAALKRLGFDEIIERRDMTKAEIEGELKAFGDLAADADWAVIYMSGYGMQAGGRNYMLPIDARVQRPSHLEDEAIAVDRLLTKVREARGLRLVILDACRENPFQTRLNVSASSGAAIPTGLAAINPPNGEVVAVCAGPGQVVADGTQRHSPYTFALLAHLEQGHEFARLLELVRSDVTRALGTGAAPAIYGRLPPTGLVLRPTTR